VNAPRLKSISGVAFGSFIDKFEQDLPETGLLLLDGTNLETGGSSGSGKSTFIHALNYPFGTCKVPLTALQNWDVDTAPSVTAVYEIDGHEVEVTRGKRFQLSIDGIPFPGSAKQKEEKLDQLFGLDAEFRSALTYRGQRKPGLFLSKTDAEKKEFLTKVLKLTEFEIAALQGEANIKRLEAELALLAARYDDLVMRLGLVGKPDVPAAQKIVDDVRALVSFTGDESASLQHSIAQIQAEANQAAEDATAVYQPTVDAVGARLDALRRVVVPEAPPSKELIEQRELEANCVVRFERMKKDDREKYLAVQRQRAELNTTVQRLSLQLGTAQGVMAQKDGVLADLETLKADKCPTCEREWQESETKRLEYEDKLAALNAKLEQLIVVQDQVNALKDELGALTYEPDPNLPKMQGVLDRIRSNVATEEHKVRYARTVETAALAQQVAQAQVELADMREAVRKQTEEVRGAVLAGIESLVQLEREATDKLSGLNAELQQRNYELGQAQAQQKEIDRIHASMAAINATRAPMVGQLVMEQDFELLRQKFLAAYFDDVLDEISRKTNDILGSIANTAHCTLQFTSEKLTAKGTVKQEIVPVVTINGHKATVTHGPSGGMLSAIELAVDLAVGAVIARRSGTCPGWLILDESFDGLGPVEKKTCMEILQTYAHDRLVIVVDHASETKGLFTQRVHIEYKNGRSQVL